MRKSMRLAVAVVGVAGLVVVSSAAQAAVIGTWGGASGNWSSTTAPAGWSNGTVPNGQGDVAKYTTGSSITTTQDVVGGVRVGTLKVDGVGDASWQITAVNDVIMDQDGAGPGTASIINDIGFTGGSRSQQAIIVNASTGSLVLADDLFISNTGESLNGFGSVQMYGKITGNGNITIENVTNLVFGQVALRNQGAFAGNTTIATGAVTFTRGDTFSPSPGNVVTIGSAGKSQATLVCVAGGLGNIENNFVAAADSVGINVFVAASTTSGNINIKSSAPTSAIRLDGNLTFNNSATNGSTFVIGDPITGVGRLTKEGNGPMRVTNTNTYQGGTIINIGSLAVGNADAFNNGFGFYPATAGTLGTGNLTVNQGNLTVNQGGGRLEIETGVVNAIADTATVSLWGGGVANLADGGYLLLDNDVNETVSQLMLRGVSQLAGTYGSTSSAALFKSDEYFSGAGMLTVLVPEPGSLTLIGIAALGLTHRRRRA
jgi:autotransporter-associated beta strand protein